MTLIDSFKRVVKRECLLQFRQSHEWLTPLWFFLLVLIIVPLATSADTKLLQKIGPGMIWLAALLAYLLALPRLFRDDYYDGSLEQWLLSTEPLALLVFAKLFAQWLLLTVPLLLLLPLSALFYGLTMHALLILWLTLLLGLPLFLLIGGVLAGLTTGLRNASLLLALLLIPLYIPPIILATTAVNAASLGLSYLPEILLLAAMLVVTLVIAPWLTAVTIRIGFHYGSV
ncbi:MAG: heme exporter protein CcmB [Gammaproteobacteria bacterium]|nr:heme exporter protein CcmB [Gammaproteobacteria bacterium]